MTIVNTVTKNILHRAWTDIEPKLLTFLATGLSASLVIKVAAYLGYQMDPGLATAIAVTVAAVAGYLKSSTTKVITAKQASDGSFNVTSLPAQTPPVAAAGFYDVAHRPAAEAPAPSPTVWYPPARTDEAPTDAPAAPQPAPVSAPADASVPAPAPSAQTAVQPPTPAA